MAEIILRRAQADEASVLADFGRLTFQQTFLETFAIPYPADDLTAFLAAAHSPASFAAKLADVRQAIWVAEQDGVLLAYANAGPCTLPHPEVRASDLELHRLYVLRAAQGLGLGRRLLDTALAWMERQGPGPMWLGVWSGNLKAQGLYGRYGFRKVGEYRFAVGSWGDDEFIFRRDHPLTP